MTVQTDSGITGHIETAGTVLRNPTPRYTMDETIDYHVILDQELDQLARPENGVIGTLGFTALGAAVGFFPAFGAVLQKICGGSHEPLAVIEISTLLLTPVCGTAAVLCLIHFSVSKYRNSGLVDKIKARPRRSADQRDSSSNT